MNNNPRSNLALFLSLTSLSLITLAVYWPGVTGVFHLDDYSNLEPLGRYGGIVDLNSLYQYIFHGVSSSLGRPLAMLTFAANAQDWPTDPRPFLITNIIIHLLNGLILFAVIYKLFRLLGRDFNGAAMIATAVSAIWLLHPNQVSTVLYVVQRMTELSTLFMLMGIWCYLHGRVLLLRSSGCGYCWMTGGPIAFGALSLLCKENAVLLPILLLVMEYTLLASLPRPAHWQRWAGVFLLLPSLIVAALLGYFALDHTDSYAKREFSMSERLLTQGRVLADYVFCFLAPVKIPTIYHDDYVISKGWLTPASTLWSVLAIVVLLVSALLLRKKLPIFSFAILWFFAAHLLESTIISLEIYFEHRNYVPYIGFALAPGYALATWQLPGKARIAVATILCLLISVTTWQYSTLWGTPLAQARAFYQQHPESHRATMNYAGELQFSGKGQEAVEFLKHINAEHPQNLGSEIYQVLYSCTLNKLTEDEFIRLVNNAHIKAFDRSTISGAQKLYDYVERGDCNQINMKGVLIFLQALTENRNMQHKTHEMAWFYNLMGFTYHKLEDMNTLAAFEKANELEPSIDNAIRLTNLYASINNAAKARHFAAQAREFDRARNPFLPSREAEIYKALSRLK